MRGSRSRFRPVSEEKGGLDVFVATAMVLPLLLLTLFGGWGVLHLLASSTELAGAREIGAEEAAIEGGVTPSVVLDVKSALQSVPGAAGVVVTGTPPPVPWGEPVTLTVRLPLVLRGFPWTFLGLEGQTIELGGTSRVSSNRIPSGP